MLSTFGAENPAPWRALPLNGYQLNGNALDVRGGKPGTVVGSGGQFVTAEVGQGFKSGGAGSLVVVPDSPTLALSRFSIGSWIRVDNIDDVQTMQIVWKGDSTAADVTTPYSLSVQGTAAPTFSGTVVGTPGPGKLVVFITNGTAEQDIFSNTTLSTGVFHHVAVTADGTTVHLYIDGVEDPVTPTPQLNPTFTSTNPLQIGGIQGNSAALDGA